MSNNSDNLEDIYDLYISNKFVKPNKSITTENIEYEENVTPIKEQAVDFDPIEYLSSKKEDNNNNNNNSEKEEYNPLDYFTVKSKQQDNKNINLDTIKENKKPDIIIDPLDYFGNREPSENKEVDKETSQPDSSKIFNESTQIDPNRLFILNEDPPDEEFEELNELEEKHDPIDYFPVDEKIEEEIITDQQKNRNEILEEVQEIVQQNRIQTQQYIGGFSNSGGGTNSKQFADGGTMTGDLTVKGTITANNYIGLPSSQGLSSIPDPLYVTTLNAVNISANNYIGLPSSQGLSSIPDPLSVNTLSANTITGNNYIGVNISMVKKPLEIVTSNYTVPVSSTTLTFIISTGSSSVFTLPNTNVSNEKLMFVKKRGAGTLTLSGWGNQKIEEFNTQDIFQPTSLLLHSNGIEWFVL